MKTKRKITFKKEGDKSEHLIIYADNYQELIEQLGKFLFFEEIIRFERLGKDKI